MSDETRKKALAAAEKALAIAKAKLDYWPDDKQAAWLIEQISYFRDQIQKQWPLSEKDIEKADDLSFYNKQNLHDGWEEIAKEISTLTYQIRHA